MANLEFGFDDRIKSIIDGAIRETQEKIVDRLQEVGQKITDEEIGKLLNRIDFTIHRDEDIFNKQIKITINVGFQDGKEKK